MADLEEVTVTGPGKRKMRDVKISPLQAGLLATAASAQAGPLAPVIGLGTYFYQKRRQSQFLDAQADYLRNLDAERTDLRATISEEFEQADPDEKRMLTYAQKLLDNGYERLAGGDAAGREMIAKGRELVTGIIQGDISQRKADESADRGFQRDFIGRAASSMRGEAQAAIDTYNNAEQQAQKILDLVNQPDFDPNKPVNKAILGEILSMGMSQFRDVPDAMDAITQGSNALGSAGAYGAAAQSVIQGITTYVKSEDFKVTAEDYNRLALNLKHSARIYAERKLGQLGTQASRLDEWGKKVGAIPGDYSLGDFVLGGEKELRFTPDPENLRVTPRNNEEPSTPTQELSNLQERIRRSLNQSGTIRRPTN